IEDLLSVSRIEAGNLQMDLKPTDAAPTVHQVVKSVSQLSSIHNFIVNVPDGLRQVQIDADKLYQVLLNLLVNAVKYSPEGGKIVISASEEEDCVRFMVMDEGIGISSEHLPHIFERFYRVEEGESKGAPGTGLGLYVSKNLIEEMGGRIWVESIDGKGSCFYFELPLARYEQEPEEQPKVGEGLAS
ncbi:MAG: ATP-binding protein, partial [Actinomycetota bacterium]